MPGAEVEKGGGEPLMVAVEAADEEVEEVPPPPPLRTTGMLGCGSSWGGEPVEPEARR